MHRHGIQSGMEPGFWRGLFWVGVIEFIVFGLGALVAFWWMHR